MYAAMAAIAACLWTAVMVFLLRQGYGAESSALTAAVATMVLFLPVVVLLCLVWRSIGLVVDVAGELSDELRLVRRYRRRRKAYKQKEHHPDLDPEDYARAQRILDEGELFEAQRARHAIGFLEDDGRLWTAVVKATSDGAKTYLLTLHGVQPYDLRAARRRLRRFDPEGE